MGPATMGERLNLSEHHSVLSAQLLEKARHAATPGEAHRLIERARIIDPTNPVVLEQSAMVHRREGRFMECIGDLLVARRRAQQSLALDGFSGVPDVLRRAPEAAKMDAQGRPLTAATSASGATATPPGSALADGNLGDRSKHEVKQWMGILRHVRFFADLAKRTPKKEPVEGEAEAPNLLAEVAKVVTVVHCGGNDLVFAQGDEGHSFYVIYSGVVSITLNPPRGAAPRRPPGRRRWRGGWAAWRWGCCCSMPTRATSRSSRATPSTTARPPRTAATATSTGRSAARRRRRASTAPAP